MTGRLHNLAVEYLGVCECPCHQHGVVCWCAGDGVWPYQVAHNDAVEMFGRCPLTTHTACRTRTEPRWQEAFESKRSRDQDRRIRRGNIRSSSDVRRAIQMGVLPHRR